MRDLVAPTGARPLPLLTEANRELWTAGGRGELRVLRCKSCRQWLHPPVRFCPACESTQAAWETLSGIGSVYAFTVNQHQWYESLPPPYVLALVEPVEQTGLRVVSGIIGCQADEVRIGLEVEVEFVPIADVWLPYFRPQGGS